MRTYYVYILTNQSRSLYIGITSNLHQRMEQHRSGRTPGFTSKYNVHRLVYFEETASAEAAVNRERSLKKWPRSWKMALVDQSNPLWRDLTPSHLTG